MDQLKNNYKKVAYVFGIIILIIVVVKFQQRISEMNHLEGQRNLIQTQEAFVMQTQESLIAKLAYVNSDEAVKAWAYSEGRWYLPNETPIIIVPAGNATSTPDGLEVTPIKTIENWQVWWELFFGKKN
ncbi:MAG: hypothetical protein ABIJ65_08500 [Chloroflexota bacterium]